MTVVIPIPARTARSTMAAEQFDRLSLRLAGTEGYLLGYAERVMDQTLAFLGAAALNPKAGLVPSEIVDKGWHTFLLDTLTYSEWTYATAGFFIHHVPDDLRSAVRPEDPALVRGRTLAAIRRAGWYVDLEMWPLRSGSCGPCHEDGNCAASGKDGNENTDNRTK